MKKHLFYIAITCGLMACSEDSTLDMAGMFSPNGETVNTRFEQSMAYNDSVGEIHLNMLARIAMSRVRRIRTWIILSTNTMQQWSRR